MHNRYLALIVVTSLLATPAARAAKKAHPSPVTTAPCAGSLYSRAAVRRARILLQLQMYELRKARLERVREAIRRNLPPDLRN
ncbi:MAG: hypothetical protein JO165_04350 [Candidatus Eremiobacteraeota bacterium]|nr:hypothetical protein [Candidatus Eremiobacteraeota bacterium]